MSRYTSLCRPSRPQPNGVSCGHRATPLATGNGSGVTRRGPYFGLGKPAIELSIIRSADSLTCPTTQGGAYARCTRVRLPWATVLNAFGVSARRIGPRPRTSNVTGPGVSAAERSEPAARIRLQLSVLLGGPWRCRSGATTAAKLPTMVRTTCPVHSLVQPRFPVRSAGFLANRDLVR